jgi:hypothetical protein
MTGSSYKCVLSGLNGVPDVLRATYFYDHVIDLHGAMDSLRSGS